VFCSNQPQTESLSQICECWRSTKSSGRFSKQVSDRENAKDLDGLLPESCLLTLSVSPIELRLGGFADTILGNGPP